MELTKYIRSVVDRPAPELGAGNQVYANNSVAKYMGFWDLRTNLYKKYVKSSFETCETSTPDNIIPTGRMILTNSNAAKSHVENDEDTVMLHNVCNGLIILMFIESKMVPRLICIIMINM